MFTFIRNAIAYCVAKVKAAYQAVVKFFFDSKEFKVGKTTERATKFDDKMGGFNFVLGFGTPSFTEETAEIVMATAEEFVKDSNDKVELAAALFWVSLNYSARNTEDKWYFDEVMAYAPKQETCAKMKDRYDALVKRYHEATVTRNEYEISLLASAKMYLGLEDFKELKSYFKGKNK